MGWRWSEVEGTDKRGEVMGAVVGLGGCRCVLGEAVGLCGPLLKVMVVAATPRATGPDGLSGWALV